MAKPASKAEVLLAAFNLALLKWSFLQDRKACWFELISFIPAISC